MRSKIRRVYEALGPRSSYFSAGQAPPSLRDGVRRLTLSHHYDAVHVAELGIARGLPRRDAPPIIYDAHNCEHILLKRRAALENALIRQAVILDSARVLRLESALLRRAALVAAPSADDLVDLSRLCSAVREKSVVIPNGTDINGYAACRAAEPRSGRILITGSMDWRPNQQGLNWFMTSVLPALAERGVGVDWEVCVAGRMSESLARELSLLPRVKAVPNPQEMATELMQAQVVAVPVLASSGTRLRILEALAAARPVVTTPEGVLGLPTDDGQQLLVRSSAEEFASALLLLINDSTARGQLSSAGLEFAKRFDWSVITDCLLSVYENCIGNYPKGRG
jgi:glycosyltransferase involved in cell wall biosynthesis